jgi:hypothetical protein
MLGEKSAQKFPQGGIPWVSTPEGERRLKGGLSPLA